MKMTDFEYAKYLALKLLYSGEDCCAICFYNKWDDVCDNYKDAEEHDREPDRGICFMGMKRYAEENADKK